MNKLQNWFNGLLVIFTGALVLTGYLQWSATREALRISERAYLWAGKPIMAGRFLNIPIENGGQGPFSVYADVLSLEQVAHN
jgi:hypothetical protein